MCIRDRNKQEEELLREYKVCMSALSSLETALEELYGVYGEDKVSSTMVEMSNNQRSMEERMQYLTIRIVHGDATAERMRRKFQDSAREGGEVNKVARAIAADNEKKAASVSSAPAKSNANRGGKRGRGGGRGGGLSLIHI